MAEVWEIFREAMDQRRREYEAVKRVRRYLKGDHDRSYMPKSHEREFQVLVQRAIGNFLPLVVDTLAQTLYVEGYQRSDKPQDLAAWDHWAANDMPSRQTLVHRAALSYGRAYVSVVPGDEAPVIRAHSPLVATAVQDDPDTEYPDALVRRVRKDRASGGTVWEVLDDRAIWTVLRSSDSAGKEQLAILDEVPHSLGVPPAVTFRNKWEDDPDEVFTSYGEIEPLIPIQDSLNDTVLGLLIAQQYSAFRQKWATGIAVPKDPETGKPIETFQAAVHRMWTTPNKDVRFGEFAETALTGYLASKESAIKAMATVAQVPPHYLLGGMVNISAEALAAAEAGMNRKASERKVILGESWGRVMRLCAAVAGDEAGADDSSARVIWRDTEARSLAATADALGKLAQGLSVPVRALWERIPGVTPFDVERWEKLQEETDEETSLLAQAMIGAGQVNGQVPPQDQPGYSSESHDHPRGSGGDVE